ncbi:hypothetical protein ABZ816_32130 [Actinosynnema sp. NPDC047251]|uniref:Putative membrane protein n=1 Tax=Saccharothrix espanaensis (strain ATCC 51144 / DSM 44229 / JCM 9112 / NBRC 15066 / NRRL 15764) TaxID=1179773 RepID=K0K091_SACES|nr:hypothetical protein [Saccharothrix espanaensis]CCH29968.1 putative membrane protein [Saccharothrix espanaensis DSM 44229]
MSTWLSVLLGVVTGLAVNEFCDVSPWLARRVVRWAAEVRYPGRAEEFEAMIADRPGKLFKLCTALGFACAALTYRVTRRRPALRRAATGWLVCEVVSGVVAGGLFGGWVLTLGGGGTAWAWGVGVAVLSILMLHLRRRRWVGVGLGLVPVAVALLVTAGSTRGGVVVPFLVMLAPVYFVVQAMLAVLDAAVLPVRLAVPALLGGTLIVALENWTDAVHLMSFDSQMMIFGTGVGVIGGLCVSIGRFLYDDLRRRWPPPDVVPAL